MFSTLVGCESIFGVLGGEGDRHSIRVQFYNNTNDTLILDTYNGHPTHIYTIPPDSVKMLTNVTGTDTINPVLNDVFDEKDKIFFDLVTLKWDDDKKITWHGPVRETDKSDYSFFNVNVWEFWWEINTIGIARFVMYDSLLIPDEEGLY